MPDESGNASLSGVSDMNQPKHLAASIRQRLLNYAQAQGEDFNLVLTRYAIERFLYRLEQSEVAERFILKGAMLFILWSNEPHRTTKDLDLLCRGDNSIAELEQVFRELCVLEVQADGLDFTAATVKGELIKADREYPGVRIRLRAFIMGTPTQINLQIDVGFGDVVTPSPQLMRLPVLLADLPAPELYSYNKETAIAEKFEAMVTLGMGNTRMKDFYDLWYLAEHFTFEGELLSRAIVATFNRRRTKLPTDVPLALTAEFATDEVKQKQWRAFIRKGKLQSNDRDLTQVVSLLYDFLMPVVAEIVEGGEFCQVWSPDLQWHFSDLA
jgi:predicted nucleotidyltransferase component of viral defense system